MAPKAKDARRIRTIFVDSQTYSAEFCILDSPKSSVIFALIITALWVIHHGTLPPRSRSIKQNRRASEDTRRFSFTHWVKHKNRSKAPVSLPQTAIRVIQLPILGLYHFLIAEIKQNFGQRGCQKRLSGNARDMIYYGA